MLFTKYTELPKQEGEQTGFPSQLQAQSKQAAHLPVLSLLIHVYPTRGMNFYPNVANKSQLNKATVSIHCLTGKREGEDRCQQDETLGTLGQLRHASLYL